MVVQAATVIAPREPGGLMAFTGLKDSDLINISGSDDIKKKSCAYMALLVREIMQRVLNVPSHIRYVVVCCSYYCCAYFLV